MSLDNVLAVAGAAREHHSGVRQAAPVTHIRWTLSGSLAPSSSGSVTFTVLIP